MADGVAYKFYLESLQPIQRVTSTDMAGYGWVREYAGNLGRFPAKPNDDGDATSQALERLKRSVSSGQPTLVGERAQSYWQGGG